MLEPNPSTFQSNEKVSISEAQDDTTDKEVSFSETVTTKGQDTTDKGFWQKFWQKQYAGQALFDWLEPIGVILVPFILTALTLMQTYYNYNRDLQEKQRAEVLKKEQDERDANDKKKQEEIALDNQRNDIMSNYIDKITELLVDKDLRRADNDSEVVWTARTRTLITLPQLDGNRKGEILKFLYEARLIGQCPSVLKKNEEKSCKPQSILNLEGAKLNGVEYAFKHPLSGIDLTSALLEKANFPNADLSRANMNQADLTDANLNGTYLQDAKMQSTKLVNTQFIKAGLGNVDFSKSFIKGANFSCATLSGAILKGSDLQDVDLRGADLRGADLSEVKLEKVKFQGALYNKASNTAKPTVFPQGFNPEQNGMHQQDMAVKFKCTVNGL